MILEKEDNYFDSNLFEKISSSNKIFWAGIDPPLPWFKCGNEILDNQKDHRLPNHFHQSFEIVYLLEINLGEYKNWPLIVDESLLSATIKSGSRVGKANIVRIVDCVS